jgi:pimeloyl-ACP methyl ester carboxylesterase
VASPRAQLAAAVRNGLLRPGADETYADGDDAAWMDVDWRALQRPYELLGRRVNVLDTGPVAGGGTPLLFIHGWSSSWQSWLLNIPAFRDTRRCLSLDLPGFGGSDMPAEPITIQGYAKTVDAMCQELGVERVAVVGNSMGGFVAAELAIASPERVERLVLVSAAGLHIAELRLERALARLRRVERTFARCGGYVAARSERFARRARLRRIVLAGVAAHPELLPGPLVAEQVAGAGRPGFMPALRAMAAYPLRHRLAQIACPALIVWGARDRVVPVRDAAAFQRLIPDARKVVYPDTGHVPMLERPARFNADLRAFLGEAPA